MEAMFRYLLQAITIIGLQCLALIGWAQEPQVERLWPDGAPGALGQEEKDRPTLICYPASPETSNGTAVVICPGGGYGHLAMAMAMSTQWPPTRAYSTLWYYLYAQ